MSGIVQPVTRMELGGCNHIYSMLPIMLCSAESDNRFWSGIAVTVNVTLDPSKANMRLIRHCDYPARLMN